MLNARAIATRGYGYGARLTAVRGYGITVVIDDEDFYSRGADDDNPRAARIRNQNMAIVQLVASMIANGALQ